MLGDQNGDKTWNGKLDARTSRSRSTRGFPDYRGLEVPVPPNIVRKWDTALPCRKSLLRVI